MQTFRHSIKVVLPLMGMLVAFAGVLYFENDSSRLMAVLAGILLVEAGAWNLANAILPSSRQYLELRAEVEGFVQRIPDLNSTALEATASNTDRDWERFEAIVAELHGGVERMAMAAGRKPGDPETRSPLGSPQSRQNDQPV